MASQTSERTQPTTPAGAAMAGLVREAWLATAELDEVADAQTRKSAFILVLESMLAGEKFDSVEVDALLEDLDDYEVREPEDDDLFSTPQLRCGEIAHYLRVPSGCAEAMYDMIPREPELIVSPDLLGESSQTANCEIALLTIAGRIAVGVETSAQQVCEAHERYRLPDADLASCCLMLGDDPRMPTIEVHGKGELRLTRQGVDAARELAQRVASL